MLILLRSEQGSYYWHKSRNCGNRIAASDLAAVFCMHKHKSRNKLYQEKKKFRRREQNEDNPATFHGKFWEQFAVAKVIDTFFPEKEGWEYLTPGSILDPYYPISCSPDLICQRGEEFIGIETKCPYSAEIPKKKEDINSEYLLQCFCCLMVTGADRWVLSYYKSATDELTSYEIAPDSDLWSRVLMPPVSRFLSEVRDSSAATFSGPRKGRKEKKLESTIRERLMRLTSPLSHTPHEENDPYQKASEAEGSPELVGLLPSLHVERQLGHHAAGVAPRDV